MEHETIEDPERPEKGLSSDSTVMWLALGGLGLAVVALLVPLPFDSRLGAVLGDLAHAPFFAGLTLCGALVWQRLWPHRALDRVWLGRLALIGVCLFGFGVGIELLQATTGRKPAWHDAVANSMGILVAILLILFVLIQSYRREWSRYATVLPFAAVALLLFASRQPILILQDIAAAHRQFPLLSSFENEMELTRWYCDDCSVKLTSQDVSDGEHAMMWMVDAAPHPAITLIEVASDWQQVDSLKVDATLSREHDTPVEMILKVIDRHHKNYDTDTSRLQVRLEPGVTQHLSIPRALLQTGPDDRELDLSQIKYVSLLVVQPQKPVRIVVDRLILKLQSP